MAKVSKAHRVKFRNDLTATYIRSILHYDPDTGILKWLLRPDLPPCLQSRDTGREAGYIQQSKLQRPKRIVEIDGHPYTAHRIAWLYTTGNWPKCVIDHQNKNSLDNRWKNLRQASHSQNSQNRKRDIRNKSGHKGVYWHKQHEKWCVSITINYKQKHVGLFKCLEDAKNAYIKAAKKFHKEFASFE